MPTTIRDPLGSWQRDPLWWGHGIPYDYRVRDELMEAVARVDAMDDLDEQTIAVGALLREIQEAEPAVTAIRARVVRAQRARGRTNREIAEMLKIHEVTVSQIAAGKQTGRKRRTS
jgi:DNA-directed RNA polymerase specialized sigma24 family protein